MVTLLLLAGCDPDGALDTMGDDRSPQDTAVRVDTGDSAVDTEGGETGETALPPADIDADGWDAEEDCDDLDPTRHPGAIEYCDGKDHDCDGETNEGTKCSDLLVPDLVFAGRIDGSAGAIIDDVTGDGLADIGVWGSVDESGASSAYAVIFAEGTLPGVGPLTDPYDLPGVRARWTRPYSDWGTYIDASGDIDGDGINDISLVSQVGTHDGGIPIMFGPFAAGDVIEMGDATAVWRPTDVDVEQLRWSQWGAGRQKGDFNGDGLQDSVIFGGPWNHIFFGGSYTEGDVTQAMTFDDCGDGDAGIDVDADGLDDIALTADANNVLLVSGSDVGVFDVDIGELARLDVQPGARGDQLDNLYSPSLVHDLDGDGYGELLIGAEHARGECGDDCEELLFFTGDASGELRASDATGSWVSVPSGYIASFGYGADVDFDGDGMDDITFVTKRDDGDPMVCLFPGRIGIPSAPVEPFPAQRLCFDYGDETGIAGGPDTNGDGFGDLIVSWDADATGGIDYRADLLLGFDVPWDEPSYW